MPGENRGLAVCREAPVNGRTIPSTTKSGTCPRSLSPAKLQRERRRGSLWLRGGTPLRKADYIREANGRFHSYSFGVGFRKSARRAPWPSGTPLLKKWEVIFLPSGPS